MKTSRAVVLIAAIILGLAILGFIAADIYLPPTIAPLPPFRRTPGDLELYYTLKTIVSTVNGGLLVCLLALYVGIYRRTRSDFTIGLIIFSTALLLYAIMSNPILHIAFMFRGYGLGPFAMLPDLFTTIALVVLLYLTLK